MDVAANSAERAKRACSPKPRNDSGSRGGVGVWEKAEGGRERGREVGEEGGGGEGGGGRERAIPTMIERRAGSCVLCEMEERRRASLRMKERGLRRKKVESSSWISWLLRRSARQPTREDGHVRWERKHRVREQWSAFQRRAGEGPGLVFLQQPHELEESV